MLHSRSLKISAVRKLRIYYNPFPAALSISPETDKSRYAGLNGGIENENYQTVNLNNNPVGRNDKLSQSSY
jgi:hypothetical protein